MTTNNKANYTKDEIGQLQNMTYSDILSVTMIEEKIKDGSVTIKDFQAAKNFSSPACRWVFERLLKRYEVSNG